MSSDAPHGGTAEQIMQRIDTTRPHTARIWNYWTGGKDNYPVDREAGDQIRKLHPGIGDYARADRLFLGRAVRHLTAEAGVGSDVDVGHAAATDERTHAVTPREHASFIAHPAAPSSTRRVFSSVPIRAHDWMSTVRAGENGESS